MPLSVTFPWSSCHNSPRAGIIIHTVAGGERSRRIQEGPVND